jgi:hypothetical protein
MDRYRDPDRDRDTFRDTDIFLNIGYINGMVSLDQICSGKGMVEHSWPW